MKSHRDFWFIAILSVALLCRAVLAQEVLGDRIGDIPPTTPPSFALLNVTVHTGTGPVLEQATILLRDGLIEAVGRGINVPADAWQIDLSGKQVYPGLIDALWPLDRSETPSRRRGNRSTSPGNEVPGLKSQVRVAERFQLDEKDRIAWRDHGILSLNLAPGEGIFQGQTALVTLSDTSPSEMIVSPASGMQMSLQSLSAPDYPASLLGVMAFIKQTLLDARHYQHAHQTYAQNSRGLPRPHTDLRLEALSSVISGSMPLLFPAERVHRIRQALQIAREHQVKMVLVGGYEAVSLAEELKKAAIPVLVSLNFPKAPDKSKRNPYLEDSLRELRYRQAARQAASLLQNEGVLFGFASTHPMKPADFLKGVRTCVEAGLGPDAALRAATSFAARILGVDDRLGTIEAGKIANLIVTDGELFSEKTRIELMFVDGERYLPSPQIEDEDEEEDEETRR
ncbi:MAG TPA: amidohydrolase family protein [Acidobacteriota bacterium]|nr:amidohydrolase family protein [Acidobacteriota bacterium]